MNQAIMTATAESRADMRRNIALLGVSVLLALLAMEIVARMLLPAPLPWLFPQVGYRTDPLLLFGMTPNQHAYSADKPVVINERGLRGPVIPYTRTPGTERILFLGDSITFGYGVRDSQVVSERVRSLLANGERTVEVVNAAVPSYNMHQEISYLETEGHRYDPDWVIVGTCWNDIGDKSAVRVDGRGRLTTDPGRVEPLTARFRESPIGYRVRNLVKQSRLAYGAMEGWRRLSGSRAQDEQTSFRTDVLQGRDTEQVSDGWEDVAAELRRLKQRSERDGFRVLIVAFPIPIAVGRSFPESSYPTRLQELAARVDIPVLDLGPAFRDAYRGHESLFIPYDGDHPNAEGHAIAAREIAKHLTAAEMQGGR